MPRALQVVDVFAGCGGLTQGFVEAGFMPVAASERDPAAAATYAANFGPHVRLGDVADFIGRGLPRADVVVGGPPCQGFSNIGARVTRDPRNDLWRYLLEVVRMTRPLFFVLENVPQFLESPAFREFRAATRSIAGPLSSYELAVAQVVNAADHGAAQVRKRAIVIGSSGPEVQLPQPTHAKQGGQLPPWRTVRDVIGHLPPPQDCGWPAVRPGSVGSVPSARRGADLHLAPTPTRLSLSRYEAIPEGGNRHDLPDELKAECWRRPTRGSSDVMGRLSWDRPAVTLRTEFYKPEKGRFLHPAAPRPLTMREGALLQGFPDSYRWCGTRAEVARQIGNAVPVPLARAIAGHLRQHFWTG